MEFKEIVMQRYATKQFDGKIVPEEKINELLEMIRFAPSGLNLQPWKIKVIIDQKVKEKLFPATLNQQQIITCSHLLVFCANTDINGQIEKIVQAMKKGGVPDEFRDMIIGFANTMFRDISPEAKLEWSKCHVYLALGNALNGAKSLGLDSCPMTAFDPEAYSRILKLPVHLVPTVLCPIGYASDKPMPKVRLSKEDIFF